MVFMYRKTGPVFFQAGRSCHLWNNGVTNFDISSLLLPEKKKKNMDPSKQQRAPKTGVYVPRAKREMLERERLGREQQAQVKEVSVALRNLKLSDSGDAVSIPRFFSDSPGPKHNEA